MPGYSRQPVPGNWNAAPPIAPSQPRMPAPAALASATPHPNSAPRPTIRLQAADEFLVKAPAPLVLPSPETLGIPALPLSLDWNQTHEKLRQLGALGFHLDHLPNGDYRVTLMIPFGNQNAHQIEVIGNTEAAAVNSALENAESWAAPK
jgi:hypothetical protein